MDEGIKKDMCSVMEDFSKAPGGKDFSKMKAHTPCFWMVELFTPSLVSI
jgi:hypothetical protein